MKFSYAALPLVLLAPPLAAQQDASAPPPIIQTPVAPPPRVRVPPPAPSPRPRTVFPSDPEPTGNPGNWATPNDYPREALRNEIEGVTRFRLVVSKWGRVVECAVTASSGSQMLDDATCALITERARFTPGRDRDGNAVEGSYSNSVRWVIPESSAPEPFKVSYTFVVEQDGTVSSCEMLALEGPPADSFPAGGECPPLDGFPVARDEDGNPVRRRYTMTSGMEIEDLPEE